MSDHSLPTNTSAAGSYYERHVFFCLNERKGEEYCCARQGAQAGFDHCKSLVKASGLAGPGKVRVNKAGCLDRCAGGPAVVVYPEARYSLIGTNAVLPESFGKLLRHLKVPVATLMCHGHHVAEPSWNQKNRGTPTSAELEFLFSSEDVQKLSSEEILERVYARMTFDDFAWRRENKVAVEAPDRAEHLHRVLYQCPHCKTEYRMTSTGARLQCEACGKTWEMDPYGVLTALEGETEFSHAPDWYEWQRRQVRAEVATGQYVLECEVLIDSLPDSKGFVQMGKGTLRHDANGLVLRGEHAGQPFELVKDVPSLYSVHIEYNYIDKKRDCIDLSTMEDTYFCYPLTRDASVTKVALATEELYQQYILKTTGKLPLVPASAR